MVNSSYIMLYKRVEIRLIKAAYTEYRNQNLYPTVRLPRSTYPTLKIPEEAI